MKISSTFQTVTTKYLMPALLITGLVAFSYLLIKSLFSLIVVSLVTLICAIFYKQYTFSLVDEVFLNESSLVCTKRFFRKSPVTIKINLKDIKNINNQFLPFFSDRRVILDVNKETEFGQNIRFFPKSNWLNPFSNNHKKFTHLVDTVYEAQINNSTQEVTGVIRSQHLNKQLRLTEKSNKMTNLLQKKVLPCVGLILFFLIFIFALADTETGLFIFLFVFIWALIPLYLIKTFIFEPVDDVVLNNDTLIVTKGKSELILDLVDIKCISYQTFGLPLLVRISLAQDTKLGKLISFKPIHPKTLRERLDFNAKHKDLETLVSCIYESKVNT